MKKSLIEEATTLLEDTKNESHTLEKFFKSLQRRIKYLKLKVSEDPMTLEYIKP